MSLNEPEKLRKDHVDLENAGTEFLTSEEYSKIAITMEEGQLRFRGPTEILKKFERLLGKNLRDQDGPLVTK